MTTAVAEKVNFTKQETQIVREITSGGFFSTTINLYGFSTRFSLPFKTFKVSGKKVGGKRHGIWQRYLDGYLFETKRYDQGRLVGLRQMQLRKIFPGRHEEYSGDVFHCGRGKSELQKYYEFRDRIQIHINNNKWINVSEIPLFGNTLGHSFDHLTSLTLKKYPKVFWSKVRSISQTNEYSFIQTKNELLNEELDGDDECIRHAGVSLSLADRLIKLSGDENLSNYHQNKLLKKALFEIETASLLAENTTDWLGLFLVTESLPAKVREQKLAEYWSCFMEINQNGDFEIFKDLSSLLKTVQNPHFNPATVELEKAFISGEWGKLHVNEIFYLSQEMGLEVNIKNIDVGITELLKLGRLFHCVHGKKEALPSLCSNLIKKKFNGHNEEKQDLFSLYQLSLIFSGHLPTNFSEKVFKSWLQQQDSKISLKELFPVIQFPEFFRHLLGHEKDLLKKINSLDLSSMEFTLLISCPELNPLLSLLKDKLAEEPAQDMDELMGFFNKLEGMNRPTHGPVHIREATEELLCIWLCNFNISSLEKKFEPKDLMKLLNCVDTLALFNSPFRSNFEGLIENIFLKVTKIDRARLNKTRLNKKGMPINELVNMLSTDEFHYLEIASELWGQGLTECLNDSLFTHSYLTLIDLDMINYLTSSDSIAGKLNLEVLWREIMSNYDYKKAELFNKKAELFTGVFERHGSPWPDLISFLSGLKGSLSSLEFQLKVLSNEELPHVKYLNNHLHALTLQVRDNPPEGLEEILLTDLIFDCLEGVGASTAGLDRNKVFSEIWDGTGDGSWSSAIPF